MADDARRDDETQPITQPIGRAVPPPEPPDQTSVLPPAAPSWSGRAGVPQPPGELRDPAAYETAYEVVEPVPGRSRTWWTPVLLGVLALVLVGLVALAAWYMSRDPAPAPVESATPAAPTSTVAPPPTTAQPQEPSPTPSPEPQLIAIPPLTGRTQDEAVAELTSRGLGYRVEYERAEAPAGTVIRTVPQAGERVPADTTVLLIVSTGPDEPGDPSATPGGED